MKKTRLLFFALLILLKASASGHLSENTCKRRIMLFFHDGVASTEKALVIAQSGLVKHYTHLPSPALTICEVSDFDAASAYFSRLPMVKGVSFFITDGTHRAGVLDRFFVKLNHPSFLPMLREKLKTLDLPEPVADKYVPGLYLIENTLMKQHSTLSICALFKNEAWCTYATPDYLFNPLVSSNDPLYARQWAIANTGTTIQGSGTPDADMDVDSAWLILSGNPDIKISIIDSGVDTLHADLVQNLLPGHDAVSDSTGGYPTPAFDNDGHGTCCAGIVGAVQNNNLGISGVAPSCKLIPVRAFYYILLSGASDPLPFSTASAFADAIGWSWSDAAADIMSNSWGLPPSLIGLLQGGTQPVNDAIATAHAMGRGGKGTAMFFSSGNENGTTGPIWPGSLPLTIAINATSMCDERKNPNDCSDEDWWGGDHGPGLDFSAPGVRIASTDMRGGFGYTSNDYSYTFNGTSAACPNAAAVGALVLSLRPELSAEDVRNILAQSCDKVGGYNYDSSYANGTWCPELGFGRVNAHRALQQSFNYSGISNAEALVLGVFPNPVSDILTIKSSGVFSNLSWMLYTLEGKMVSQGDINHTDSKISVANLDAGIYLLQCRGENFSTTKKVVVTKP